MKKLSVLLAELTVLIFAFALMASADPTNRYVVKDNPGAAEPYDDWTNAAGDIQTAVSYAYAGETVWVSNGVYDAGGLVYEGVTNRVAIDKTITVRSANNDPTNTIIKGAGPNGPAAVRCVYMIDGSSLIGFTLTNGATLTTGKGGGAYCGTTSIISNCVITGNSAATYGGGAYQGKLYDCTLIGNSTTVNLGGIEGGGGAYGGTLFNCTIVNNSAVDRGGGALYSTLYDCMIVDNYAWYGGGGVYDSTLYDCMLTSNSANYTAGAYDSTLYNCTLSYNSSSKELGGGAYLSDLYNCTLVGNSATYGGGARESTLYNCTLVGNSAGTYGGGTYGGTLCNCVLIGNSAVYDGGGANQGTLYNCTLTGNSAVRNGGGVYGGTMYNCISWGNNKVDYLGTRYYSCAAGITGDGTITNNPLFIADGSEYGASHVAGNYRLSNHSPCINTGTNFSWMTTPGVRSKDLDGSPRIDNLSGQVDMGCYEHLQRKFTIISIH